MLLSVGIYLSLVGVLGFVLARFARPDPLKGDFQEDEI